MAGLAELLRREEGPSGLVDANDITDPQPRVVSATGDVWILGNHRVLCGDGSRSEDLERLLEGHACDLVFTDLPYNVDYSGKTASQMKLANDNLGAAFPDFLKAACQAMLQVSAGPFYICMSSSELHNLHAAFTAAGGRLVDVYHLGQKHVHARAIGLPTPKSSCYTAGAKVADIIGAVRATGETYGSWTSQP